MTYKTEQEKFWAGEFGNEYIKRNTDKNLVASSVARFAKAFARMNKISSVLELGSNIGLNLRAINQLVPDILIHAAEINSQACEILQAYLDKEAVENSKVFNTSILEFEAPQTYDLTISNGVLIHINPNELQTMYKKLYEFSNKYIYISEYYNPTPVEVNYRGHKERLFKRDFAGEMLDLYPDLDLLDYGFIYHRDKFYPADDPTWFLLAKK